MQPGTWKAINLNVLSNVDPKYEPLNPNYNPLEPLKSLKAPWSWNSGQACVIHCWNGGAIASRYGTHGAMLVWGGGHKGYYGNEVYAFDLASRRWVRLSNPYPTPNFSDSVTNDYPEGRFPDGTPVPPHTYDQLEYHPATNSFVAMRGETDNLGGYSTPTVYMFSLDQRQWRHSRRNAMNHGNTGGYSFYDASRDVFWVEGGSGTNTFVKFDPKVANGDGTYGQFTNFPPKVKVTDAVGARDPINDIGLVTTFRNTTLIKAIDLKAPQNAGININYSGDVPNLRGQHGWEWSETRSAFIYWVGGGVYELKLNGSDWKTGTWVWKLITSSSNTVNPPLSPNGVYSRFRIVKYGNVEFAILVTMADSYSPVNVYAFRL